MPTNIEYGNQFYTYGDCPYRLPCGYCEKLGRDCPKVAWSYSTTVTPGEEKK